MRRKTHDKFVEEVNELAGSEYEVLGKYKTNKTKILMKHNECESSWEVRPYHFLNGTRCPVCWVGKAAKKRKLTQKEFVQKVEEVHGGDYFVIGEYKGSHAHVEVKHVICGHIYNVTATNITSGKGCPECAKVIIGKKGRVTHQEYVKRVKDKYGNEYEPIEEYIIDNIPIKVRHNTCGHEWKVKPNNLISGGKGCPRCNESRGEKRIRKYFDYSYYNYETQYRIDECRNIDVLPFDFAVFHHSELICLIEYEGIHHFEPVEFFGGTEYLKTVQKHDEIKRNYCMSNDIPLIEIPYWEENSIENILHKKLLEIHRMNNIKLEQLSLFN